MIIKSKVTIPFIEDRIIESRSNLISSIIKESDDKSLIYVISPAGSGKTTLFINISNEYKKVLWISLDKDDNNIRTFLDYLIFSIKGLDINLYNKIKVLLDLSNDISSRYILYKIFEEISIIEDDFTLFIDDFHLITDDNILDIIKSSIKYIPPNLKIFISSRNNNLKLTTKTFIDNKVLIKKDISFSKEEIKSLILKENLLLDDITIDNILKKTNGWILAIKAVISFNHNKKILIADFSKNISELNEYFLYEIFESLDKKLQRFLITTALIGKFNHEIANYLLNIKKSNEIIKKIIDLNLFIQSIDDLDSFKYHDLFSDFLVNHFKNSDYVGFINTCNKVSIWFETNNNLDEAIKFSFQSENKKRSLDLIEKKILTFINEYSMDWSLEKLISIYSIDELLEKPIIIIYLSWFNYINKKFDYAATLIDLLESKYINIQDSTINSHIYALKSCFSYFYKKFHEAEFFAKFALKENPESIMVNTYSNLIIALIYIDDDVDNKALEACNRTLSLSKDFKVVMLMSQFKRDLLMKQLNYTEAKKECLNTLEIYKNSNIENYHSILRVYVTIILIAYEKNDLELFKIYSKKGFEIIELNKYLADDFLFIDSQLIFLIAYAHSCTGFHFEDLDVSLLFKEIEEKIKKIKRTTLYDSFIYSKINYLLSKNLIDDVETLIKLSIVDKIKEPLPVIQLRYLLKNNELNKSKEIIEKFLFQDIKHQNQIYCIQALVFQAIIHTKNKHIDDAIFILKQSLRKTQHEELISIYTEVDDDLVLLEPFNLLKQELLNRNKSNINIDYVSKIINFLNHKNSFRKQSSFITKEDLFSNFTSREKDVFLLLIQDVSNKEIAEKLFISENTLKTHIKSIYKNLGIKNRDQIKIFAKINKIT